MKHLKFMLAIILMLLVIILIVQNHEAMSTKVAFKVKLLFLDYQSTEMSLYYVVTISFLFGVIIVGLYGMMERFHLMRQIRVLTHASREKDQELNSLRNLPITTEDVSSESVEGHQEEAIASREEH